MGVAAYVNRVDSPARATLVSRLMPQQDLRKWKELQSLNVGAGSLSNPD